MQRDNYDIRCRDWKQSWIGNSNTRRAVWQRAKHELIPPCTTTIAAVVVFGNDPLPLTMVAMVGEGRSMEVTTASSSVDLVTSIFIADCWCHLFPSLLLLFDGISTLLSAHLLESCDHIWYGIVIIPASVTATALFPPPRWIDIYHVGISVERSFLPSSLSWQFSWYLRFAASPILSRLGEDSQFRRAASAIHPPLPRLRYKNDPRKSFPNSPSHDLPFSIWWSPATSADASSVW